MDADTIEQWGRGIRTLHVAHAKAAARFARRGKLLGIPVIVLTSVLGTGIFAAVAEENIPVTVKIVGGLLATLATVLSALQTFLGYPALAERHDASAIAFGELRRDLERSLGATATDDAAREALFEKVAARWSAIERESPVVPGDVYRKATERVTDSEERRRQRAGERVDERAG